LNGNEKYSHRGGLRVYREIVLKVVVRSFEQPAPFPGGMCKRVDVNE
jgi:hypothetical protein